MSESDITPSAPKYKSPLERAAKDIKDGCKAGAKKIKEKMMSGKSKNGKYSPDESAPSARGDEVDAESSLSQVRMHIHAYSR
jgi:hypothetical protein